MQKLIILTLSSLLLGACSWLPDVYQVPRYQGNIVEQKMVDQLAPGMSRDQVVFIMGNPLVEDPFHPDRWDYVYTAQTVDDDRSEERITLLFAGDKLTSLQGDFKPEPQPEGVVVDAAEAADEENPPVRATAALPVGEDTTVYTGGKVNAIPPEGEVTETKNEGANTSANPYTGLTPDGHLVSPTPTPVKNKN